MSKVITGSPNSPLYLTVTVICGKDLAPRDSNGLSDPYCVLRLSTGTGTKKTHIIRKTLNPMWDETFDMGPVLEHSMLKLTCWDHDIFSSDDFEGQFNLPLDSLYKDGARKRAFFALAGRPGVEEEISGAIEIELQISSERLNKQTSSAWSFQPIFMKKKTAPPKQQNQVFGVHLSELMKKQEFTHPNLSIPVVCADLIADLTLRGTQEEGIFRIAGRFGEIEKLKQQLDQGESVNFEAHPSIHDISGLFKKFLRELPEPLLTYELFDSIVGNYSVSYEDDSFLELVRTKIAALPAVNYELLRHTVILLQMIARHSDATKMSLQNLVICLAPNVLWDKEETIYMNMDLVNRSSTLFSLLVIQHEFVFNFKGEEVIAGKQRLTTSEALADEARMMFITYDTNGDGDLQPDEFAVFYKDFMKITCNEEPTDAEIQGAIIELDEDKNGEISLEEFTTWWKKYNEGKKHAASDFVSYAGSSRPPLPPRNQNRTSVSTSEVTRKPRSNTTGRGRGFGREARSADVLPQSSPNPPTGKSALTKTCPILQLDASPKKVTTNNTVQSKVAAPIKPHRPPPKFHPRKRANTDDDLPTLPGSGRSSLTCSHPNPPTKSKPTPTPTPTPSIRGTVPPRPSVRGVPRGTPAPRPQISRTAQSQESLQQKPPPLPSRAYDSDRPRTTKVLVKPKQIKK